MINPGALIADPSWWFTGAKILVQTTAAMGVTRAFTLGSAKAEVTLAVAHEVVNNGASILRLLTQASLTSLDSLPAWHARMTDLVPAVHAAATLATLGAFHAPSVIVRPFVSAMAVQLGYLDRWVSQIVEGEALIGDASTNRAGLYGHAAWGTSQAMQRMVAIARGKQSERRLLGRVEDHCPDCPPLAQMGWKPIGTLPPIGDTVCSFMCRCRFAFR